MTSLELYQAVNQTKSLTDLMSVVKSIKSPLLSEEQIKTYVDVIDMIILWKDGGAPYIYSRLTRTFGIRQQAIMLVTYKKY